MFTKLKMCWLIFRGKPVGHKLLISGTVKAEGGCLVNCCVNIDNLRDGIVGFDRVTGCVFSSASRYGINMGKSNDN